MKARKNEAWNRIDAQYICDLSLSSALSSLHALSSPLSNLRSEMLSTLSNHKSVNGFTAKVSPFLPGPLPYLPHVAPAAPVPHRNRLRYPVLLKGHIFLFLRGRNFEYLNSTKDWKFCLISFPERALLSLSPCQLTPKRKPDARGRGRRVVGRASNACLDLATDYTKTRRDTVGGR